jgi:murein DD-endopeptidase MepM/ murein hydrolase activator NlpD
MRTFLLTLFVFAGVVPSLASAATITVMPEHPIQGDPLKISIVATSTVRSVTFGGAALRTFQYQGMTTALYGIDLYKKAGDYAITATLTDGTVLSKTVTIVVRKKEEAPLGIPEKLGGNTPQAATQLVSTLAQENASLLGLRTGDHAFWTRAWRAPVADPIVTDTYGYSRQTGGYSIAHKGTDFRAAEGTPVLAMNRGVARLVQTGRNYGKTLVVDHGLGVQTLYLHLSKILVNQGELVLPGQVIALSGQTGYADRPHLHLSVRIGEVSVDPEKFLELFK